MLACLVLRRERLRVTVEVEALCVTLDSMSLVLVSVIDVLIEVIGGEIVVNNTAGTSGFFCKSVGHQRFKRRGYGIQFIGVE